MGPVYKLSYFDVRALAEPIRLLFAFQGVEYTDDRVPKDTWPALKPSKPWGNMPVLEEDGKVLSQSGAIIRYLGKKYNMAGGNDFESAKCDELIESMNDLKTALFKVMKEEDAEKKKEAETKLVSETFPFYLGKWNEILEKNGTGYLVGNKLTIADLHVASYLQIFSDQKNYTDMLNNFAALKKHQLAVFNAKGIKEWVDKRPKTEF